MSPWGSSKNCCHTARCSQTEEPTADREQCWPSFGCGPRARLAVLGQNCASKRSGVYVCVKSHLLTLHCVCAQHWCSSAQPQRPSGSFTSNMRSCSQCRIIKTQHRTLLCRPSPLLLRIGFVDFSLPFGSAFLVLLLHPTHGLCERSLSNSVFTQQQCRLVRLQLAMYHFLWWATVLNNTTGTAAAHRGTVALAQCVPQQTCAAMPYAQGSRVVLVSFWTDGDDGNAPHPHGKTPAESQ